MTVLRGIPTSPGVGVGPALIPARSTLEIPETKRTGESAEAALERFRAAVESATAEVRGILETASQKLQKEEAAIFEAHLMMLDDPALLDGVTTRVRDAELTAESATAATARKLADRFAAMEDEYFRERAADVRDIGLRILKHLKSDGAAGPESAIGVLVTEELLPSDAMTLDPARVAGIVTERGGATSHASILARALGIPCVVGVVGLLSRVKPGDEVAVDGAAGELHLRPDAEMRVCMEARAAELRQRREAAWKRKDTPAYARDGRRVTVLANAKSEKEVAEAVANGAEGIGLFRTEFLFLDRRTMPTEEEQTAAYKAALEAAGGRPVAIRLLDIGGDKPAPYLEMPREENPFLGERAVRLLLRRPDVMRTQIRAILRASDAGNASILIPMISVAAELEAVREAVSACRSELEREGRKVPRIPVGVMIEVPSAALCAPRLARACDYFSVGTNDLTQYCMAADRGNPSVAALYRPTHPAVLSLIRATVGGAKQAGIKVGVCGEMASDEKAIPLLIHLGVDSLSVAPAAVPLIKECARNVDPASVIIEE